MNTKSKALVIYLFNLLAFAFLGTCPTASANSDGEPAGTRSSFDLSKIDESITKEFVKARNTSNNGVDNIEAMVLIFRNLDGSYRATVLGPTNENKKVRFKWDYVAIALVHTHQTSLDPKPSTEDRRLASPVVQAQKSPSGASYFRRANERYAKGDIEGAIADFNVAITFDPHLAMAYNNRGVAREQRGEVEDAIADYGRAIEINPRLAESYANRAKARLALRDYDGAAADCDAAIGLNPRLAQVYNTRGTVRCEKSDPDGALAD